MKNTIFTGLVLGLSLSAFANGRGPEYLPNNGTAQPGNPGTGKTVSDVDQMVPQQEETLNRSNTSVNPVPEDTDDLTLQGKSKQSQEEGEVDFSTAPGTDHSRKEKSKKP